MASTTTGGGRAFLLSALILIADPSAARGGDASSTPGIEEVSEAVPGPAEWRDLDGPLVASGSGRHWVVCRRDGSSIAEGEFDLPAHRAVLARGKLYFDQGDRIATLVPGLLGSFESLDLALGEGSELLVGRVHDYLSIVEQGKGVHLLTIPPPPGFDHGPGHVHRHAWPDRPMEVSFVPNEHRVAAMAADGRTAYLALERGGIAVLAVDDPLAPRIEKVLSIPGPFTALAVNGHRMFVLGGGSLSTYDLSEEPSRPVRRLEGVVGTSMELSGRSIDVAYGPAITTLRDESITAVTHIVTLTNFEFMPQNITVEVGDTVRWENTEGTHDTDSCNVGQTGCTAASTEAFDSGAPAGAPWTFSHTFTKVGPNPYTCTLHAGLGMVGSVRVDAAAAPPPAVPDGEGPSNPVRVTKLVSTGSSLEIAFDSTTCTGAGDTQIVGGIRSDLPSSPGGSYGIRFSRCGCGTTSPCTWTASPQPTSGQLIWFVLTATDGSTTEGSWGRDSAGNERSGPGTGGSSGQCGVTGRDLSNTCGH